MHHPPVKQLLTDGAKGHYNDKINDQIGQVPFSIKGLASNVYNGVNIIRVNMMETN